jgi:hypothetical protein
MLNQSIAPFPGHVKMFLMVIPILKIMSSHGGKHIRSSPLCHFFPWLSAQPVRVNDWERLSSHPS